MTGSSSPSEQPQAKRSLKDRAAREFCRVWLAGRAPRAPGTCGSAVAAILAPWCFLPLPLGLRLALLAVLFVVGAMAADRVERMLGKKDPGEVVIDEVLGQWICYLPFTVLSFWGLAAGFVLFRIFDIAKPWPVKAAETLVPGGYGVMLDDVVAGAYAMACLFILSSFLSGL
jgi:phosphatidylglycerophosphatase A